MANSPEEVSPITRKIQEMDCGVDHGWVAINQAVARRMLNCLDKSEVLKVIGQESESDVLAPNEPNNDIEHIVMESEGHQTLFQAFSRQGANVILVASVSRWE